MNGLGWDAMYRALRPFARLIREEWYLRGIRWANRSFRPACRPLLVLYRAAAGFQLFPEEISAVLPHLRGARRFLVFGLGHDSKLWQAVGPAETHFLEHDPEWIDVAGRGIRHVHPVAYRTSASAEAVDPREDRDFPLDLPEAVAAHDWDVVLVDAPPGHAPGLPGRLQSIRAASRLVRPAGIVAVHDLDRDLEKRASERWLGSVAQQAGRLGVFHALWGEAPPFESEADAVGPVIFEPGQRPFMDPERVVRWYRDDRIEITVVNFEEGLRYGPRHEREVVLVRDPWYPSSVFASVLRDRLRNRPVRGRVFHLSNTEEIHRLRRAVGLDSHFVNLGAFVDGGAFSPSPAEKRFDAAMISRFSWFECEQLKRHDLTVDVPSLALLDPGFGTESNHYRDHYAGKPNCHFINEQRLGPAEVNQILRQSHCGLILSPLEGVCRASSEYLLCGLPVVSTRSRGGRDVWYDEENSIVVDADSGAVAAAVASLVRTPRDPARIRARYLERAAVFRERLITDVLEPVMQRLEAELTARQLVETVPFPWWPEPS